MNRRRVFFSATALVLAALALPVPGLTETLPQDGEAWFTNVPVVTQDGKTLRFYEDVMKGKVLLINFFFTDCDNVCPLATANLVRVRDLFGTRGGDQVQFVSISLQPEHDTPDVMRAFANKHGADGPGWLFLTGKRDDIELLRQRLGFRRHRSRRGCRPGATSRHRANRQRADASLGHGTVAGKCGSDRPVHQPSTAKVQLKPSSCR